MRKLLGLALLLLAAAARGQGNAPMQDAQNGMVLANGGTAAATFDPSATQPQGTIYAAPTGANGAASFQVCADGMGIVCGQGATPGNQQTASPNFNIQGKGIAGTYEMPSGGCLQGTALGKWCATSTDGRWQIAKATPDTTGGVVVFGTNVSASPSVSCNATSCGFSSIGGFSYITKITASQHTPAIDTATTVALSTTQVASNLSTSYRECNATSNNVAYTLVAASQTGHWFTIKKTDTTANTCTITRSSSDTIDGLTTVTLTNRGDWVTVVDNSNGRIAWQIKDGNVFGAVGTLTAGAESCASTYTGAQAGAIRGPCFKTEALTLATGATTTATTLTIPANAIVVAVEIRVNTTITTATSFTVKLTSNSTGAVFSQIGTATTSNATLTSGTQYVMVPTAHADQYVSAVGTTTITITCNVNPGAGAVRIHPIYYVATPPTS